jgi:hypothetical protein
MSRAGSALKKSNGLEKYPCQPVSGWSEEVKKADTAQVGCVARNIRGMMEVQNLTFLLSL